MAEDTKTIGITVKKDDDMPEWYTQVCLKAELADFSPIKGCMVIRPNGLSMWTSIQDFFNKRMKLMGVRNAYFPLFIPESFFKKEAEHAKGFKPEVAWVESKEDQGERLAIRPTSEAIMYDSYSKWVRSWRDLPLRINQWCNVVRWEVSDTKLFLRTREFLWQEGHCVYETEEECDKETRLVLDEYVMVAEELLAIPVLKGYKSEHEKFAGASRTYTFEALMPDGKALQTGTSHNLGQNFGKAFDIQFVGKDKEKHYPYQNSWGISTRMIGAVVMVHGDNKGLVLPPRAAENKVVIVPIIFDNTKDSVLEKAQEVKTMLHELNPIIDDRDEYNPGYKYNHWELRGIPLRIEIGPKDVEKESVMLVRRDTGKKESVKIEHIQEKVKETLDAMHHEMFEKAKKYLYENIVEVASFSEFVEAIKDRKMVKVPSCGKIECEDKVKELTNATCRVIPFVHKTEENCFHCNEKARHIAYFARSY